MKLLALRSCLCQTVALTDEAYEDRYTYDLAQNRYKPVYAKTDEVLRLFEIPFRTFDCEDFRFVFIAMHAVATLYAPKSFSAYADLRIRIFDQLRDEINSKNSEDNSANVVMDFTGAHVTRSTVTDLLTMARFGKSENVCIDFTGAVIEDDKPDEIFRLMQMIPV